MRISDWSSDVCSSDLSSTAFNGVNISGSVRQSVFRGQLLPIRKAEALWLTNLSMLNTLGSDNDVADQDNRRDVSEIFNVARHFLRVRSEGQLGRESCRERGCQYG